MESVLFKVSDSPVTHVVLARYWSALLDDKHWVVDVSIVVDSPDPGDHIDYSEKAYYSDVDTRDCDFHDFDEVKAEKLYAKALKAVNA